MQYRGVNNRNILYQNRHGAAMWLDFGHLEEQGMVVAIDILKRSPEEWKALEELK